MADIYSNLLDFTAQLSGEDEVHDNLTGMAALAGNGVEAAAIDTYQTLNFTHWIGDILDGYQQEKRLEIDTPEYNANQEAIRESITKINNLAHGMGFREDVIPTPKGGKEVSAAASAVYNMYALPYQAQKNYTPENGEKPLEVDYAKYTQIQAQDNPLTEAMRQLNSQVAQSDQYGKVAAQYWKAATKAAKTQTALNGTYLLGMDMINDYTKQMEEFEHYLTDQVQLSEAGKSDTHMGGGEADKIDFENDDADLHNEMRQTLQNMKHVLKTEKSMLSAGHINTGRLKMFGTIMADYTKDLKKQKKKIESDNLEDIKATAELEEKLEVKPEEVREDELQKYQEMVLAQQNEKSDITNYLDLTKKILMMANVAAIPSAMGMEQMLRIGKFFYDAGRMSESEQSMSGPELKLKGSKDEDVKENIEDSMASEIRVASANIADNFRNIMREHMVNVDEQSTEYGQMDEDSPLYLAMTEKINDVLAAEQLDDEHRAAGSRNALLLLNNTTANLGYNLFDKQVQEMTDEEVLTHARALRNVMYPLQQDGDYLKNFANLYAVGSEEMNDIQKDITDSMQNAMLANQPEAAIDTRDAAIKYMSAAQRQSEYDKDNTTVLAMDDPEQAAINKDIEEADELYKQALATYTPMFQKLALTGMAAAYKKHEYNKAWKESIRERNFRLICEGTLQAMEESKQETQQNIHHALHGPGGLLYG